MYFLFDENSEQQVERVRNNLTRQIEELIQIMNSPPNPAACFNMGKWLAEFSAPILAAIFVQLRPERRNEAWNALQNIIQIQATKMAEDLEKRMEPRAHA